MLFLPFFLNLLNLLYFWRRRDRAMFCCPVDKRGSAVPLRKEFFPLLQVAGGATSDQIRFSVRPSSRQREDVIGRQSVRTPAVNALVSVPLQDFGNQREPFFWSQSIISRPFKT